jgi:hypothetical protein
MFKKKLFGGFELRLTPDSSVVMTGQLTTIENAARLFFADSFAVFRL